MDWGPSKFRETVGKSCFGFCFLFVQVLEVSWISNWHLLCSFHNLEHDHNLQYPGKCQNFLKPTYHFLDIIKNFNFSLLLLNNITALDTCGLAFSSGPTSCCCGADRPLSALWTTQLPHSLSNFTQLPHSVRNTQPWCRQYQGLAMAWRNWDTLLVGMQVICYLFIKLAVL